MNNGDYFDLGCITGIMGYIDHEKCIKCNPKNPSGHIHAILLCVSHHNELVKLSKEFKKKWLSL